jgi:hypothetical protein
MIVADLIDEPVVWAMLAVLLLVIAILVAIILAGNGVKKPPKPKAEVHEMIPWIDRAGPPAVDPDIVLAPPKPKRKAPSAKAPTKKTSPILVEKKKRR